MTQKATNPITPTDAAVVVPVFNRAKIVTQTLDSIAAQTHRPRLVVAVDDGSSDHSADVVEQWAAEHQTQFETRVIRQANAGVAHARNRGVSEIGDMPYVALLDSDDIWPDDFLERTVAVLHADPQAVAASIDLLLVDYATGAEQLISNAAIADEPIKRLFQCQPVSPSATLLRTATFHRAGGIPENLRLWEDTLYSLRAVMFGPWLYVPGRPVRYRKHVPQAQATHFSHSQGDYSRTTRAQVLQHFIETGGAEVLPIGWWKRELARHWYNAGQDLVKSGRKGEAAFCFTCAAQLRPTLVKAHLKRLICGKAQPLGHTVFKQPSTSAVTEVPHG